MQPSLHAEVGSGRRSRDSRSRGCQRQAPGLVAYGFASPSRMFRRALGMILLLLTTGLAFFTVQSMRNAFSNGPPPSEGASAEEKVPSHWAFVAPRRPEEPAVQNLGWCRNAIDRFILARLEKEHLAPSPEAPRETLLRRVTLDLTGLPPTPAEVEAFLADTSPDAYPRLVKRLLASPRYGEHMATDWLDCARYGDSHGFADDYLRTMWHWRDWVIDAFNSNMPFDRFTVAQLAGDLLPGATQQDIIATGFNRNSRANTESGSIDEEWRVENAVDRVETTATVFLGLTVGCARCHDHKYDPITQKEFYQLFAFFNSLNERGVYWEKRGNEPPLVSFASPENQQRMQQLNAAVAAAEKELREAETALAAPPALGATTVGLLAWLPGQGPLLAASTLIPGRATAALDQSVKDERSKKLTKLRKEREEYESNVPSVMVMEELPKPRDTYLLKRGQYDMPDQRRKLEPGVPAILHAWPEQAPRNRLGLARWLMAAANPLTARVTVNRYWQHYFGTGLVKTANNFGTQGEAPSHPELLDWLATEFMRTGWDVKALQRTIVLSATYRQSSRASAEALARDPDNRLLARGPRFRLSAEALRDNALAISGLLVEKIGGPPIKPYQPEGLWKELEGGAGTAYVQDKGANLYRRSVYMLRRRSVPHPLLATFDAPSREICQVQRQRTDTPLQALTILNEVAYVEAARHLAQRMLTEGGATAESRLTYGFRCATARVPLPAELQVLEKGLDRYRAIYRADPEAARQLLAHGDSPRDDKLEATELAAYASVATILLNLDETLTKE